MGSLSKTGCIDLQFRRSVDTDRFLALGSKLGSDPAPVPEGELCYAQESTILTRQMAWRQSAQGLLTQDTTNALFLSEILAPTPEETNSLASAVLHSFGVEFSRLFGCESFPFTLSVENPTVTFEIGQTLARNHVCEPKSPNNSIPNQITFKKSLVEQVLEEPKEDLSPNPKELSIKDLIRAFDEIEVGSEDVIVDLFSPGGIGAHFGFWNTKAKEVFGFHSQTSLAERVNERLLFLGRGEVNSKVWDSATILLSNSLVTQKPGDKVNWMISRIQREDPCFVLEKFFVNPTTFEKIFIY